MIPVERREAALRKAISSRAAGWALGAAGAILLGCGCFPWGR